jgi:signal transduction histidine kinase
MAGACACTEHSGGNDSLMQDSTLLGASLTGLSVVLAVAVLAVLLLVATSQTPDRFRLADSHSRYLQETVTAVARGVEVAESQRRLLEPEVERLDLALSTGSEELHRAIVSIYEPHGVLDVARMPLMEWINLIAPDAGELTPIDLVVESERALLERIDELSLQLGEFAAAQVELEQVQGRFDDTVNGLITSLREDGKALTADNLYVHAGQVRASIKKGTDEALDSSLAVVDEILRLEAAVGEEDSARLRQLINTIYTIVSIRRSMSQATTLMDLSGVEAILSRNRSIATKDQLYVLRAVNDARVLLNVYTMLLLVVLAFFGIRLKASHRALNRSHDDLEKRVEERTEDLAQANTDLKESQVQLVQAEKMSSLGQLVAGVMHEINTPLLYVLNNTSVTAEAVQDLSRYLDATLPVLQAKNSEEGRQAIKHMLAKRDEFDVDELVESISEIDSLAHDSIDGLNQISELVQSLKDFSRLDRVAEDKFDVREGIEKTLTITRNLLKGGVEVRKDLQEVPLIHCSPSRLNQVFINLVTNAVQAMDEQGVLTIKTCHMQSTQGEWVEVTFEDTGCGIPAENIEKVMDPFFTTKPVGEGTGLGLSIVRQIIDQHSGQIFIDSKEGHGTRITLSLPIAVADDGEQGEEAA